MCAVLIFVLNVTSSDNNMGLCSTVMCVCLLSLEGISQNSKVIPAAAACFRIVAGRRTRVWTPDTASSHIQCFLHLYLDLMLIHKHTNYNIAKKKESRVEWMLNVEH